MTRTRTASRQIERIIGIDPGSVQCGVGIIERRGRQVSAVHWETIMCGNGAFAERLDTIYGRITALCQEHAPDRGAIEGIFHYRNANSALKLGHARGVALLALTHAGLNVQSYQPTEIKRAVGSYGAAGKDQVRDMVCRLLALEELPGLDASDALAIALTAAWEKPALDGAHAAKTGFQKRCNTHRSVAERAAFKRASKKPCCVTKHAAVNGALAHKTNTYRCHSMQQTPRMSADPRQNI